VVLSAPRQASKNEHCRVVCQNPKIHFLFITLYCSHFFLCVFGVLHCRDTLISCFTLKVSDTPNCSPKWGGAPQGGSNLSVIVKEFIHRQTFSQRNLTKCWEFLFSKKHSQSSFTIATVIKNRFRDGRQNKSMTSQGLLSQSHCFFSLNNYNYQLLV